MTLTPDLTEQELVAHCLQLDQPAGRRMAQRLLFERYKRAMYSVAFRMLNDYDHANDALQDAFVEVFRQLHTFRFHSTLGAWIKTIVVRQALRKRQLEWRFETINEQLHDAPVEVPDSVTGDALDAAIRSLPDGARTVFVLAEVEGYKYQEIAIMLNISEGTCKSQVSYARKLLRRKLAELI
ncbi:hypothetical protein GCM10027347_04110 [Larkinella harenae]